MSSKKRPVRRCAARKRATKREAKKKKRVTVRTARDAKGIWSAKRKTPAPRRPKKVEKKRSKVKTKIKTKIKAKVPARKKPIRKIPAPARKAKKKKRAAIRPSTRRIKKALTSPRSKKVEKKRSRVKVPVRKPVVRGKKPVRKPVVRGGKKRRPLKIGAIPPGAYIDRRGRLRAVTGRFITIGKRVPKVAPVVVEAVKDVAEQTYRAGEVVVPPRGKKEKAEVKVKVEVPSKGKVEVPPAPRVEAVTPLPKVEARPLPPKVAEAEEGIKTALTLWADELATRDIHGLTSFFRYLDDSIDGQLRIIIPGDEAPDIFGIFLMIEENFKPLENMKKVFISVGAAFSPPEDLSIEAMRNYERARGQIIAMTGFFQFTNQKLPFATITARKEIYEKAKQKFDAEPTEILVRLHWNPEGKKPGK